MSRIIETMYESGDVDVTISTGNPDDDNLGSWHCGRSVCFTWSLVLFIVLICLLVFLVLFLIGQAVVYICFRRREQRKYFGVAYLGVNPDIRFSHKYRHAWIKPLTKLDSERMIEL